MSPSLTWRNAHKQILPSFPLTQGWPLNKAPGSSPSEELHMSAAHGSPLISSINRSICILLLKSFFCCWKFFAIVGTIVIVQIKKFTLKACRPMGGRPGDIFEIFQNGHIFFNFLFFKNIKKKKRPRRMGRTY